jgi:thiol-disulfide isomerase/thioredoxin
MSWRGRFLIVAVAVFALAAGAGFAIRQMESLAAAPEAVDALFAQTFDDAAGNPQPLAQWRDQLLVVNFWATWCAPCVEEMPELERVHRDYQQRNVTVIGLAIDNPAAVARFRDQLQLTLPLLVVGTEGTQIARDLGNPSGALPYTVLIEPPGRVVQGRLGRIREAELRAWLNARLSAGT